MRTIQAGLVVSLFFILTAVQAEVSPESIVDILNRLEKLESQNRELRGNHDELKNELQKSKKAQKQGFLNIDEQIDELRKSTGSNKPATKPSETVKPDTKPAEKTAVDSKAKDVKTEEQEKPTEGTKKPESATVPATESTSATDTQNKKIRQPTRYEKDTYKAAFNKIKVSPSAATRAFKEYIKMQPNSPLAANSQYWIGEIMYSHNNYKGAVQEFIKVLQSYKYSEKAPDAAIKLGYSFYALKKWDLARRTFEDVLRYFPENKNVVNLANKRLEKMKANGK